jgi:hypothetical protein
MRVTVLLGALPVLRKPLGRGGACGRPSVPPGPAAEGAPPCLKAPLLAALLNSL